MSEIDKVLTLMRGARFCMVTTRDGDELRSRPMTPQQITDTGDVWCFVSTDGDQAKQVAAAPHVNVSFDDDSSWVSLSGTAEVVRDEAKIDELWDRAVEAWFPDGREAADLALLHVRGTSAEYWDTPGGAVAAAVAFVQSAITGERPDVGENDAVELPRSD
jgi:general stress protein 26